MRPRSVTGLWSSFGITSVIRWDLTLLPLTKVVGQSIRVAAMELDYVILYRVIDSTGEEMRLSVGGELGLITEMLESAHNFRI